MLFTFIDLFAGIGGFRIALERLDGKCVYSSEIDKHACQIYEANFGVNPYSDIIKTNTDNIPDFDILCAGFPCQSFSKAGKQKGFNDETRGLLFFEIIRILEKKKPKAFILENVKNLLYHDRGHTFSVMKNELEKTGYTVSYSVLNAKDFGLPQNRERIFIVGMLNGDKIELGNIEKHECWSMKEFLDKSGSFIYLDKKDYTILDKQHIKKNKTSGLCFAGYLNKEFRRNGVREHTEQYSRTHRQPNRIYSIEGTHPTISSGETAGRYYIYDGEKVRKLTLNECFRFFGFPETFIRIGSNTQLYRRIGNSVCIPVVESVAKKVLYKIDFSVKI